MPTPLEEVVGQNYKYFVRFLAAVGAIIGLVVVAGDRARAFVDDRVDTKLKLMDATLVGQAKRIERMENQLDEVRTTLIEIRSETTSIKQMLKEQR